MKRFAFLVLLFTAAAIAEEAGIKQWAEDHKTNVETVQMCINNAVTTEAELIAIEKQLENNQEMKKNLDKYDRVTDCWDEKAEMAIAEKAGIKQWAQDYQIDVESVQMCINNAVTTEAELIAIEKQLENNPEMRINFFKYSHVMACVEKKEMMEDSKLDVGKKS